jgi:hypothetical protein
MTRIPLNPLINTPIMGIDMMAKINEAREGMR